MHAKSIGTPRIEVRYIHTMRPMKSPSRPTRNPAATVTARAEGVQVSAREDELVAVVHRSNECTWVAEPSTAPSRDAGSPTVPAPNRITAREAGVLQNFPATTQGTYSGCPRQNPAEQFGGAMRSQWNRMGAQARSRTSMPSYVPPTQVPSPGSICITCPPPSRHCCGEIQVSALANPALPSVRATVAAHKAITVRARRMATSSGRVGWEPAGQQYLRASMVSYTPHARHSTGAHWSSHADRGCRCWTRRGVLGAARTGLRR